ncbi:MAG: 50S ribosomal protein L18 [Deltaproteobacteria bacterium RBG_13_58_19]|nr:MAG: 50S ribosomal protein L18 [Deltaproteobacteria bacterium RBG_13_58_19]
MGKMSTRLATRLKRKRRIRKKISGSPACPRLSVFRSARHIYAQIIDDLQGSTLAAAGTLSPEIRDKVKGLKKTEAAREVGRLLAEKAKGKGIIKVVFDRNGFLYHGRVKTLADSCREHGLEF